MISLRGGAFCGNKNFVLASRSSKPLASMVKMSCLLHTSADLHFSVFGGGFAAGCCFSRSLWPLCEDPLFKRKIGVRKIDGKKHQPQPPTNHSLTIKKISERSLVSNKFETVYLNAKTGGSFPKKNQQKTLQVFLLPVTNHPKTVGQWNRRGLIGQLHKVFDIGRINFLYKSPWSESTDASSKLWIY